MGAEKLFEQWWDKDGRFIDPDTDDVPWFDKRKELAGMAFAAAHQMLEEALESLAQGVLRLRQYDGRHMNVYCQGCHRKKGLPHLVECPFMQAKAVLTSTLAEKPE